MVSHREEIWDLVLPLIAGISVAACAAAVDIPPPRPIDVFGEEPGEILAGDPDPIRDHSAGDTGGQPEASPRVVVVNDAGGHRPVEKVFFEANSARIPPTAHALLEQVAAVMAENPQVRRVAIEGHSDRRERHDAAERISRKRAKAVRDFLVRRGVERERLVVQAHGFDRPLDASTTEDGRARNRRVEFRVLEFDR